MVGFVIILVAAVDASKHWFFEQKETKETKKGFGREWIREVLEIVFLPQRAQSADTEDTEAWWAGGRW
jgi:hypothetical protein